MDPLRHLDEELARLDAEGLLREPRRPLPPDTIVLCSNDYLGYATEELPPPEGGRVGEGAAGCGASRLISGERPEHGEAEAALAAWLGHEDALLFSSGYAANVGALGAIAGSSDVIVSDALNHASIIDGCRLSRARIVVAPHRDVDAVDRALQTAAGARRRFVVTESYFSMDGTSPDLAALRRTCDAHDAALVVDEAHALGVLGEGGRGLCHAAGIRADVLVGTLGKALGLMGAFVAGSRALRGWLWNRARSFVFSTGVSPTIAAAATRRVARVLRDDPARQRLLAVTARFRDALAAMQAPIAESFGPIVPWLCADPRDAVRRSEALFARGVFVQAIRPPTVPAGGSRLRITLHAKLSDAAIERALDALRATRG
jgi:8-amino-7-oxononanoate synthase